MRVFSACHSHGGTHILDTVRHVPTHLSSPALRAQVILRRFASATNLLICGQRFLIVCGIDEATATHLHRLLCRLGAFPELLHPLTSHRDRWLPSGDRAAVSAMQYATSTDPCVDAGDKTAKEADPCVDQDVSPVATTDPCVDRDDVGGCVAHLQQ